MYIDINDFLKKINLDCEKNDGNFTTFNYKQNPEYRDVVFCLLEYGYIEKAINPPVKDLDYIRITQKGKLYLKEITND